jgi:hypothetical protein
VIARSLVLVAALAFAAGCNGKADGGPVATIPPSSTSTSAPTDPYAVPAVIDEAYVNRVLAALDQVEGDVVRSLVANRIPQVDDTARLRAIYNDPQFQLELDGLIKSANTDLSEYRTPPGNRKTRVTRLLAARPNCIVLEADKDFSEVVRIPPPSPPDEVDVITLLPTQADADPKDLNPTPWSIKNAEIIKSGQSPEARAQCPA